jgi:hypothetical protein
MADGFKVADLLDAIGVTVRGVRIDAEQRDAALSARVQATDDAMQALADRLARAEHDAAEARAAAGRLEARVAALEATMVEPTAAASRGSVAATLARLISRA